MLGLLSLKKRIINVDESWVPETNYNRSMWYPKYTPCTITDKFMSPRLALIAALIVLKNTSNSLCLIENSVHCFVMHFWSYFSVILR